MHSCILCLKDPLLLDGHRLHFTEALKDVSIMGIIPLIDSIHSLSFGVIWIICGWTSKLYLMSQILKSETSSLFSSVIICLNLVLAL